ncbi:MAG TPA: CoA transferase [Burkholderiales bacterium]|nr:CoA transferase [Burkholderiales bacterium]
MADPKLPLSRYTVLDLTSARSGPTAVRQLADWGANVIKIEDPAAWSGGSGPWDRRHGSDFQNLQRNKRSLTLNLKSPEGVAIFKRLADRADVVVENFRPRVKHRLGIDYETLKKTNPRLIYASISGFGQEGPYRERPGLDHVVQGMGGLMSVTGLPGQGPVRVGIAISDSSSGIYCAFGIVLALLEREHSGEGQWVNTSLLQALIAMLDFQAARWLIAHEVPPQAGNDHPTAIPTGVFKTADGYINIAASGKLYERLCKALGAPELFTHPDFSEYRLRSKNRIALNAEIGKHTVKRTSAEWIEQLNAAGVPCGPIYTIDKMFADPQVQTLGMAQPVVHPQLGRQELLGQGVNLSRTPAQLRTHAPDSGEHTREILEEFGYDAAAIDDLKKRGVV